MTERKPESTESIKSVFDITGRINERTKILVEQHNEVHKRIDKLVDKQEAMVSKLAVLKTDTSALKEDVIELKKFIVDNNLEMSNKFDRLTDRVSIMETEQKEQGQKVKSWHWWIELACNWLFKVAWVVIAAYILARVGLGGTNIPLP